ncbi:hypothetical protein BX666DRAFT_1854675 [Dichotomocladium elegans]|nr:hypothetical protein BX666DRAFT_1854675 [Dichotomocladium elegans]
MDANPGAALELTAIYSYMRDLWEHIIAHYMYAFGALWMSWAQVYAYCDQVHGPLSILSKILFAIGSLLYGLLIAGVAVEFPYGLYVGLPYSLVLGIVCACLIMLRPQNLDKGGILTMGRRMVLQYYLGASVVALVIVIGWLAKYGFKNRLEADVF